MDLMKELIEAQKNPHKTDIPSYREQAKEMLQKLTKVVDNVSAEDPDSDSYNVTRAIEVSNYLKDFTRRMKKEAALVGEL